MFRTYCLRIISIFAVLVLAPYATARSGETGTPENIRYNFDSAAKLRIPLRLPLFYDDASYLRFVSKTTPLASRSYAPSDLVSISGAVINEAGRQSKLRKVARDALWEMA